MSRLFLIFLFLSLRIPSIFADDVSQVLTWEDVIHEAKAHNPELISALEQLNQAKASKALAQSGALPQVSSNFDGSYSKATQESQARSISYGVTASQLVFDGMKTSNEIRAAIENIKASDYNYAVVSSNVRLNLRTAFIELLNAQENLTVTKDIAHRRKQNLDLVKLNYEGGTDNKGSLLTSQADLAQAQFNVVQAERDIELSQRRLVQQIGWEKFEPILAKDNVIVIAGDTTKPVFEEMVEKIPFLRQLIAQKDAARFEVKSAVSSFFPQVYLNAGASKSDSGWPPHVQDLSTGFSVTLPLFQGGAQQAELAQAKAIFGQAQAQELSGRESVLFTLANTWIQWQDSVGNFLVQYQYIEAAKERAKIAEAEYSTGLINFNDWIIIEDDLVSFQQSFLTAKTSALTAEAEWEQAKGETLDEEK
jgi:outer membrane protein TolC